MNVIIPSIHKSLVCCKSDTTQNFIVLSYLQHPKAQKLLCTYREIGTLLALFGNKYDQIYFSFFSNCEEIKLSKAPPEK